MVEKKLKGLFGGGEAEAPESEAAPQERRRGGGGGGGGRRRRREMSEAEADFVNRYQDGPPSEGFTSEEAVGYLQQIRGEVPPEVLQRAAVASVQNLPAEQRKQFAEMLERRQQGTGMVTIERSGQAREADGRGGGGGQGGADMNDVLGGLFGTLMGGGMGAPAPAPMPQQGMPGNDDLLGGLLGTILGGATAMPQGQGGTQASDPFGDILGSLMGGGMGAPAPAPQQQPQAHQQQGGGVGSIGDILGSPLGKAVLGGIAAYAMKEMMGGNKKG